VITLFGSVARQNNTVSTTMMTANTTSPMMM